MSSNATVSSEDLLAAQKMAAEQLAAFMFYVQHKIETLWTVLLVTYLVLCGMCLALIIYLRRNRSGARRGDSSAARKIILPAFEPLLWILCCATGLCSIYFMTTITLREYPIQIPSVPSECFYAGRQAVLLLVIVFMLQKSVTLPALRRAVLITFGLSIYTIPVVYYMTRYNEISRTRFNFWLYSIVHALNIPIFMYVLIKPPARASKAALRQYCVFAIIQQVLEFSYNLAFYHTKVDLCFNIAYSQLAIGSTVPLFIWRVLKADTEHWRGLGQRACALQSLFRQRTNVNERISSQGLHVLIEMHRKYIIDFAYLELRHRIGVGSSAIVYSGILNSKTQVAIKVYTPTTVTEDTVAEFSHEAALCGALNHPNIVQFYGMCVCPPTICLVSELCQGSLDVVTASLVKRHREPRRQQFLINLGYMIDAARAVAYIHSFSPAFVHRDIKPGNFLIDLEGNVKLTDFGESRSLPSADLKMPNEGGDGSAIARENVRMSGTEGYVEFQSVRNNEIKTLKSLSQTPIGESRSRSVKMTVKGTADYMAPEVINGKGGFAAYDEAADVYSLAITMWDILYPEKEKYPNSNNNHLRVFETVIAGTRPEVDPTLHPGLRELLTNSWHQDHWRRPSTQTIVQTLERIQEETAASFAQELSEELQQDAVLFKVDEMVVGSVTGECCGYKMRAMESVASVSEAIRLGNMLMSAGFLHHVKHTKAFEHNDSSYFFDEHNIRLCQPFAILEVDRSTNSEDGTVASNDSSPALTSPGWLEQHFIVSKKDRLETRSLHHNIDMSNVDAPQFCEGGSSSGVSAQGGCGCRRLGQRLQHQKSTKRLFKKKHVAIPEDSVLTATLLGQDGMSIDTNSGG